MERVVLAVDGGNSKTDLALAARGRRAARACARRAVSSPHHLGLDGAIDAAGAAARRRGRAGRRSAALVADAGAVPAGRARLPGRGARAARRGRSARLGARAWRSATTRSRSCARAPSAAGASRSCAARGSTASASGRTAGTCASRRSGAISGDWGGGFDVGLAALFAAARSEDGRGPETALERTVPAHFGLRHAGRARRGDPPRPDPAPAARRAAAASCSTRPRSIRSRRRSSTASPREIVALAHVTLAAAGADRRTGRRRARRRAAAARGRAADGRDPRRARRGRRGDRRCAPPSRRRSSARRCWRWTTWAPDGRRRTARGASWPPRWRPRWRR